MLESKIETELPVIEKERKDNEIHKDNNQEDAEDQEVLKIKKIKVDVRVEDK